MSRASQANENHDRTPPHGQATEPGEARANGAITYRPPSREDESRLLSCSDMWTNS